MARQDDLEKLIEVHNRRLQILKEQQALQGITVDPKILLEIQDIENKLADLQAELAALPEIIRRNPYRGLLAFREKDAEVFFGRETFTSQLVERVQQKTLVMVLGSSGSGKSSIVFAGLVPHLRRKGKWMIASFRPGREPFRALAAALLPFLEPDLTERLRLKEIKGLAADFEQGDLTLDEVITRILGKSPDADRLLLIADQFEELYTLCPDPEIWRKFLDVLLASGEQVFLHLVLTLRADFIGQALDYRPFADALSDADMKLGPMKQEELRQVIELPAEKQKVSFEPGLVGRILSDVSNEPGHLPLLEFALTALWEEQTQEQLNHDAYKAIGGVEGALSRHADEIFESFSEAKQEQARRVFIQMVQPSEGTEDTCRLATKAELGETAWSLVQRLATERLVVTDQAPDGQETVELVHESLIRGWGQLSAWMKEARRFRAWQERLRVALHQWEDSDQDPSALLRGALLAEAENWLTERGTDLSQAEQAFIRAGVISRERRGRSIILGLVASLVVMGSLALLAGWLGWLAGIQAKEQRLRAEEAESTISEFLRAEVIDPSTGMRILPEAPEYAINVGQRIRIQLEGFDAEKRYKWSFVGREVEFETDQITGPAITFQASDQPGLVVINVCEVDEMRLQCSPGGVLTFIFRAHVQD